MQAWLREQTSYQIRNRSGQRFFGSQDENRQLPRETQQSNGSNAHYDCARPTQHFHP